MPSTATQFGLEPVRVMATRELVLEQIQTAINLGRFRPGDRLPTERDLADMLHVSRTTVREAIGVLQGKGVIEVRRGRTGGLIVREVVRTRADLKKVLRANRDELRDTFDYRVAVESAAAALAAQRRTRAELTALRRLVVLLSSIVEQGVDLTGASHVAQFLNVDSQLHLAIARSARSNRLAGAIVQARSAMFLPVGAVFTKLEPTANHLHEQVVEAIASSDADLAGQLMTEHINATRATIEAWL